jgi:hypothetical protein
VKAPADITIPFFAYGIFRPGELGFLQIRPLVERCEEPKAIMGSLLLRDGLPIVDSEGHGEVPGASLHFKPHAAHEAYERIAKLEPDHHYRWAVADIGGRKANYLAGKSPSKGSVYPDFEPWSGKEDPFFNSALEVVGETLRRGQKFKHLPNDEPDLKPLFRLEMAYLLLWSSIERYCSFRYGLGDDVIMKILCMAEDPVFRAALKHALENELQEQSPDDVDGVPSPRQVRVFRADKPQDFYKLTATDPKESLRYYYQIRCNATHRGKGAEGDHETLQRALAQLLAIFRRVLAAAFAESAQPV